MWRLISSTTSACAIIASILRSVSVSALRAYAASGSTLRSSSVGELARTTGSCERAGGPASGRSV
eukprot:287336-Chlamydomonas_euryale.AAC.1